MVTPSAASPTGATRTALVLGGGGNLGALQIGFIRRIAELAIPVDFVVGTSVGALNAAHVAFHDDPGHDCLTEIWRALRDRRLFHRSLRRITWQLLRHRMSLFDDAFVRNLAAAHLDADDFAAARIPLYITATNLRTGQREILHEGSVLQALLASSAIPGLFPPVRIGGELYVDGGVADPTDIAAAVELGAERVIAISLRPELADREPRNVVDVLLRSIEIVNEQRVTCTREHAGHQVDVVYFRPGLGSGNPASFDRVEELIERSYEMACSVFDRCWDGANLAPGDHRLALEPDA